MYTSIKKKFFFENWGRNSNYILTSGLLNRLNAREDLQGNIILPEGHCICEYSLKQSINYDAFSDLHIVIFDGIRDFQEKTFFFDRHSNKNIHIHYVGKFNYFWKNIPNSSLLYLNSIDEHRKNIENVKKNFPISYSQNLRKFFITLSNINKDYHKTLKLFFSGELLIYFGNIKPNKSYISNLIANYKIDKDKINLLIDESSLNFENKIKTYVQLIFQLKNFVRIDGDYHNLIEFINTFFRLIISNFIKNNIKNSFIYDGGFLNKNFINIYNSYGGNHHKYIDFGSKIGFDIIYPRTDDIIKYKPIYNFIFLDEEILDYNEFDLEKYFNNKIINFVKFLTI
jgi:hypothetical protein